MQSRPRRPPRQRLLRVLLYVGSRRPRRALLMGPLPGFQLAYEIHRDMGQRLRQARRGGHQRGKGALGRRGRGARGSHHRVGQTLHLGLQRAVAARLGPGRVGAPGPAEAARGRFGQERPFDHLGGEPSRLRRVRRPAHVHRFKGRRHVRLGLELRGPGRPRFAVGAGGAATRIEHGTRKVRRSQLRSLLHPRRHRRRPRLLLGLALRELGRRRRARRKEGGRGRGARVRRRGKVLRRRRRKRRVAHARRRGQAARGLARRLWRRGRGARPAAPGLRRPRRLGLQRVRPGHRPNRPRN
mmetsp:Transcript_31280/g.105264  ORF Transcript_31280/g.105264 Transcript_31280/m.105264 type:complete len:298 (+) Transcript_31280:697-1590(+)